VRVVEDSVKGGRNRNSEQKVQVQKDVSKCQWGKFGGGGSEKKVKRMNGSIGKGVKCSEVRVGGIEKIERTYGETISISKPRRGGHSVLEDYGGFVVSYFTPEEAHFAGLLEKSLFLMST